MGEVFFNRIRLACLLIGVCFVLLQFVATQAQQNATLIVDTSQDTARKIPETLFGVFFEEINHAGSGGLWAELVSNRGFEAGGEATPSNIAPWSVIGNVSYLKASTERTSPFERNKVALKMEVLCENQGCPAGGVGIYNPGFWGMNIEQGKNYKLIFYARSTGAIDLNVSLTVSSGSLVLATANIVANATKISNWTKMELLLEAKGTDHNSRLQFTTNKQGVIWFDQVSLMPVDTHKGHGFRNQLFEMIADLKPKFIRVPGGTYVEGQWLRNAFRWKETIGPWEQRPGHWGDTWLYWTDDGLGYFELLQLSEDLGALPIWVFNCGISRNEQVEPANILPFVQEALDGIEFAIGDAKSKWGSVRAAMGHSEPFDLRYVAIGNEDCDVKNYEENYRIFYSAIKRAYPSIQIISNCDGSSKPLTTQLISMIFIFMLILRAKCSLRLTNLIKQHVVVQRGQYGWHFESEWLRFKDTSSGSFRDTFLEAFVSEYAVWRADAGTGSLLAALAEAGFLIGLETNSDVVSMASYAPLFVNANNRGWTPDAIVFDSYQMYGTPSYYMQQFFIESSGATLLNSSLQSTISSDIIASAITWKNGTESKEYLRIKVVNFGSNFVNLKISITGLEANASMSGLTKKELTSGDMKDENSFEQPKQIVPKATSLASSGREMDDSVSPHSITSFDLLKVSSSIQIEVTKAGSGHLSI